MELSTGPDLRTHDLVLFRADDHRLPAWADRIDGNAWGVVRRADTPPETIPLGVRGRTRDERRALDIRSSDVVRSVAPETLIDGAPLMATNPALAQTISAVARAAQTLLDHRAWGPTGSAGFELATGVPVVHRTSDLDMIVRTPDPMPRGEAAEIAAFLTALPSRVDCLLETGAGAVALTEWADRSLAQVVVRTPAGPILTADPWSPSRSA